MDNYRKFYNRLCNWLEEPAFNTEKIIPWKEFFKREPDPYTIFEIKPTSSIRNNQAYVLAKVIAGFYRKPSELLDIAKSNTFLTVRSPYRVNFRIVMKDHDIGFYLLVPKDKENEIIRKVEGLYDAALTIDKIDKLDKLNPSQVFCSELHYRKHDIFSLNADRNNNYPLPSLLTAVRTLEGNDIAVFDAMLEPYSYRQWLKEAKESHTLLEKGYVPDNSTGGYFLRLLHQGFTYVRNEILDLTRFTPEQKAAFEKWKQEESSFREARRLRREMTPETRRKQDEEVLNAYLRIAVQSESDARRKAAVYTLGNAWKDINGDNELDRLDIPESMNERYVNAIEERKPMYRLKPILVSTEEAGKFLQLPGDSLIKEYPEIRAQKVKEVRLPDEASQENIKHVRIGEVTERGTKRMACIPLEAYKIGEVTVTLKAVYDALCTATFGQGKQGTGKSEGFGATWAYDMIVNGFTAIVIDTADGQVLRNLINSLPEEFPDENIHALNLDNKAWPVALNWSDIYGRKFTGTNDDEELQALEISERVTAKFVSFINSLTNTGEFSDRMQQYVVSCMRAITTFKVWSFLDLELSLSSPSYRDKLLQLEEVKQQPEVVRDLMTLQDRAAEGKEGEIINPILSRIRVLSGTQFMANMFYQEPKLNDDGTPVLDLRSIMDNTKGGKYGQVMVIQASSDAWGDNQATILGFMLDKINFNAFSRIDQDQGERKPCLVWIDEPHKVIKSMESRLAGTSVEFRKYRVKNLFTGHSIEQMGAAANSLLDGGAQITSYKTERLSELARFAHSFTPYDDAKTLYEALPEKHYAINAIRLPSGKNCPAFIAHMVKPPDEVKDRSDVWQKSAEKYGRPWKEVKNAIQDKRLKYQELDSKWTEDKKQASIKEKATDALALKEAKKALNA